MSNSENDDLLNDTSNLLSQEVPAGVDRRTFLMRSAVVGATAVMTGRVVSAQQRTDCSTAAPPLAQDLNVVQKGKGPVLTTVSRPRPFGRALLTSRLHAKAQRGIWPPLRFFASFASLRETACYAHRA